MMVPNSNRARRPAAVTRASVSWAPVPKSPTRLPLIDPSRLLTRTRNVRTESDDCAPALAARALTRLVAARAKRVVRRRDIRSLVGYVGWAEILARHPDETAVLATWPQARRRAAPPRGRRTTRRVRRRRSHSRDSIRDAYACPVAQRRRSWADVSDRQLPTDSADFRRSEDSPTAL